MEISKDTVVDPAAKRPVGHSTHNLFVKDKKSGQLYLVTMRQSVTLNLKELAASLGCKEVRFATNTAETFGIERGCLTLLSLLNNPAGKVIPVVDSLLFTAPSLRVCCGCNDHLDHSQHNIVDISPDQIQTLLKGTATPPIVFVDMKSSDE